MTELEYYQAGILYNRGSLIKNYYKLQLQDRELVECFNVPVYQYHSTFLIILRGEWVEKVKELRNNFQDLYMNRHFVRSTFDCCGTLILHKDRYLNISIVTKEFLLDKLRQHLHTLDINTKHYYRYNHTDTFQMLITGSKDAKRFLNWIYFDTKYYLTRKFQKYQDWLQKGV